MPKKTVQSSITSMGFPLLEKTGEMCVENVCGVPGKFWNFNRGHMNEEEETPLPVYYLWKYIVDVCRLVFLIFRCNV
jgi:hypothetical protein